MIMKEEITLLDNEVSAPQSNTVPEQDIDEVLENASCGCGTAFFLSGAFLLQALEGAEVIILSVVGLMVKCEWDLTPFWVAALQMNVLISMGLSSFLFSSLADTFGRKPMLLAGAIGTTVFGGLCGLSTHFWHLFTLRALTGASIGIALGPASTFLAEIPPKRFRALSLTIISLAWGIGSAVTCCVAYFTLEPYGWRGFIMVSTALFSPSIILIAVIRESPRFDVVKGRMERAEKSVQLLYKLNCVPADNIRLTRHKAATDEEVSLLGVLNADNNWINLILMGCLATAGIFIYYTVSYGTPRFLNEGYCSARAVEHHETCIFQKSVLKDLIIVSLTEPLGVLLAALLANVIGRRKTGFLTVVLTIVAAGTLYICINRVYLVALLTVTKGVAGMAGWLPFLICAEYFPTTIRALTQSLTVTLGRIGGALGIFATQFIFNIDPRLLLAVLQGAAFFMGTILIFLKKETMGLRLT